ncbi:phosphatidate cytidylyltransferase, partial [Staphylococcus epidermidis]|uniref:phosphatidate cytidylyltransferase n=1 Tax=Staphylococcus epidermidis TaxID=1282 RepID=UPI0037D9B8DC
MLLTYTLLSKNTFSFIHPPFSFISLPYLPIPFIYFYHTRSHAFTYILFPFLILSLTHTPPYIFPPLIRKHNLSPLISPNKTI